MERDKLKVVRKDAPQVSARLHWYRYDLNQPNEKREWDALSAMMAAKGVRCAEMWGGTGSQKASEGFAHPHGTVEEITLDTGFLFSDQWNEAEREDGRNGRRLFDWFLTAPGSTNQLSQSHRVGHWLELSPEAEAERAVRYVCGYCGAQYRADENGGLSDASFCLKCIDEPHLEQENLKLLRLRPVCGGIAGGNRPELSEAEAAWLVPFYVEQQTIGSESRAVKARERKRRDVVEEAERALADAAVKRDGFLWLLDRFHNVENVIYYGHKTQNGESGVFSFGWRRELSPEERGAWLDVLAEFPFQYELKGGEQQAAGSPQRNEQRRGMLAGLIESSTTAERG